MALPETPLTRAEEYLNRTATGSGTIPDEPLTRVEQYLAKIAGEDVTVPDVPYTRIEQYLDYIAENGGGGGDPESITFETLNVSQNGTTNAPSGTAYNKVVAAVPVPTLDTLNATANGTYTPTTGHAYSSVVVAIPAVTGVSF